MREIRPSGSEGGAAEPNPPFLPLSFVSFPFAVVRLESLTYLSPSALHSSSAISHLPLATTHPSR
jgi:hypothetical protein